MQDMTHPRIRAWVMFLDRSGQFRIYSASQNFAVSVLPFLLWGDCFERIPMLGQFTVLHPEQVIEGSRPARKAALADHQYKVAFAKHLMDAVILQADALFRPWLRGPCPIRKGRPRFAGCAVCSYPHRNSRPAGPFFRSLKCPRQKFRMRRLLGSVLSGSVLSAGPSIIGMARWGWPARSPGGYPNVRQSVLLKTDNVETDLGAKEI